MSHPFHAICFLCGARVTASELLSERRSGNTVTRQYECSMCAATHEVSGYLADAASTSVGQIMLTVSRRQAGAEIDDLASAVANECGLPVPMAFLANLSQAIHKWADGTLPTGLLDEYQRIRELSMRYQTPQYDVDLSTPPRS